MKSTPLPGREDLQVFRKDIDASVTARYREIMPEVHRLLARQLGGQQPGALSGRRLFSSGRGAKSRAQVTAVQMSLRLMTVGRTIRDAKAAIVVFTQGEQTSGLDRLVKQPLVQQLCQPDDGITPSFEIIIVGEPARKRRYFGDNISAVFDDASGRDSSTITYCGARIVLDAGERTDQSAVATLGGLVKLTFTGGDFMLVGMTAGHVLEDLCLDDDESESDDSSDFEKDTTNDECPGLLIKPKRQPMGELLYPLIEPPEEHGAEPELPAIPPRDWALFEMKTSLKLKPNLIPRETDAGAYRHLHQPPRRPYDQGNCLSAAAPESFPFTEPAEVVMIASNSNGEKASSVFYGELSHVPSTIILNSDQNSDQMVEAYILTLDEKKDQIATSFEDMDISTLGQIQDGHSGAWVVNPVSMEVYGHVVATDFTGDGYVIPLHATFGEIREKMPGVEEVSLPGVGDLLDAALRNGTVMRRFGRRESTNDMNSEGGGDVDGAAHEKATDVVVKTSGRSGEEYDGMRQAVVYMADRDRRTSELLSLCGGGGSRAHARPKFVDLDSDLDSGYGSGCGSADTTTAVFSGADLDKDRGRNMAVEGADISSCRIVAGRERRRRQSFWLDSEDSMRVSVW